MKRYILFAGLDYYPSGGMRDMKDSHNEIAVLQMIGHVGIMAGEFDWWHIYDIEKCEVVEKSDDSEEDGD